MKKKLTILLLFLQINICFGTGLQVFDLDKSQFPFIKTKILVNDKDNKFNAKISINDIEIKENGEIVPLDYIELFSYPQKPLSYCISLDISKSMNYAFSGSIPFNLNNSVGGKEFMFPQSGIHNLTKDSKVFKSTANGL